MSAAEVMTTALVAAQLFGGNQQMARQLLKEQGYIPNMLSKARFNRRLHQIAPMFQSLFESLAADCKAQNPHQLYAIDSYPVPACDVIRISGAKLYQGEVWRGKIASKRRYFYGLKLHLMVTEAGVPVEFFLTPGSLAMFGDCGVIRLTCPRARLFMQIEPTVIMGLRILYPKRTSCLNRCSRKTASVNISRGKFTYTTIIAGG